MIGVSFWGVCGFPLLMIFAKEDSTKLNRRQYYGKKLLLSRHQRMLWSLLLIVTTEERFSGRTDDYNYN